MPTSIAVLAWRLGLGWLAGRKWALLTSLASDGSVRHSAIPYVFGDGNIYLHSDRAFAADLRQTPRALVQAAPGPLGVRSRPPTPDEVVALPPGDWIVLEPTAEPVPDMVPPDLVWLWPVGVAIGVALALGLSKRRHR